MCTEEKYMKNLFRKATWLIIMDAAIFIVIGVIAIIFAASLINFLTLMLGLGALVIGVVRIVSAFISIENRTLLFSGIPYTLLGLFLALFPSTMQNLIAVVIGLGIFFSGVTKIISAIGFKEVDKLWWIGLIVGITQTILGIIVFADPFGSMQFIITLIGIYLIYSGISFLLDSFVFHRKEKNINVEFTQYENRSTGTIGEDPIDVEIVEKDNKD